MEWKKGVIKNQNSECRFDCVFGWVNSHCSSRTLINLQQVECGNICQVTTVAWEQFKIVKYIVRFAMDRWVLWYWSPKNSKRIIKLMISWSKKNIVPFISVSHDCIFPNNLLEGDWSGNSNSYVFSISNPLWPKYHILDDYGTLLKNSLKLLGFGNKDNAFSCRARGLSQNNGIVQHLLETGGRVLVCKWNTLVATTVAKDMATEGIN